MSRVKSHSYFFPTLPDNLNKISDVSSDGSCCLSHYIGETMSSFIRNRNCPLELVRLNRVDCTIVAQRRFNDIRLTLLYHTDHE